MCVLYSFSCDFTPTGSKSKLCQLVPDTNQRREATATLGEYIGHGTYGQVYKCNLKLSKYEQYDGAWKTIQVNPGETQNSWGKLRALRKLKHVNVLRTRFIGSPNLENLEDGLPGIWTVWLFQDFCEGSCNWKEYGGHRGYITTKYALIIWLWRNWISTA